MRTMLMWVATTPAGSRLGEAAARDIRLLVYPSPWYTVPLEPLRWLNAFATTAPHTFVTMAVFVVLSLAFAAFRARRRPGAISFVAAFLAMLLTLGGLSQALRTFDTIISVSLDGGGLEWQVPPDAPYVLADLHAHTQASGGALMPEDVVAWHHARGYRVVAITDSNGMRGVERAQAFVAREGLPTIIVPGEEYRGRTHLLLLNPRTPVLPSERSVTEAIADGRAQGATVLVAHPWTADLTPEALVEAGAQGFEVTNGSVLADADTRALAARKGLPLVGDIDFRHGQSPTTATVLPAWVRTPADVQEALRRGECAALFLPDRVDEGAFSFPHQLVRTARVMAEHRLAGLGLGVMLWTVVLVLMWGRWRPLPCRLSRARAFLVVAACAGATAAVAAWCMWWQLRTGWFPRSEWAFYLWALAVPVAWWALPATGSDEAR